jgi:hypothetical protein
MFVDGPNVPAPGSMVVKVFERFRRASCNGRIDHASNTIVDEVFCSEGGSAVYREFSAV